MVEIISIVDTYLYSEQLRVDTDKISIKYNEAIILQIFVQQREENNLVLSPTVCPDFTF